jgi:hypothetical protein
MKRLVVSTIAGGLMMAGLTLPALADNSGDGSGYGTQPGYTTAQENSDGCAGHGAFGAFGKDNSWAGGANGYNTGVANGTLCGNRQGNL